MNQFLDTFFVESAEKLDELERGLLDLDPDQPVDHELVNDIFRAAHTIKGGAGSFGFMPISDFTHVMETLLDELRDDKRSVTPELVNLLLEGKDCLGELLDAAKNEKQAGGVHIADVEQRLRAIMEGTDVTPASAAESATLGELTAPLAQARGWDIYFAPHPEMMHSGNDPLRILKELADLGELSVVADTHQLPSWDDLQPDDCYLCWQISLLGSVTREQIDDVFLWVEGECELSITPVGGMTDAPAAEGVFDEAAERESASGENEPAGDEFAHQAHSGGAIELLAEGALSGDVIVERRKKDSRRQQAGRRNSDDTDQSTIRVAIGKIDSVINQVGELITTQSIISNLRDRFDPENVELMRGMREHLDEAVDLLERHTRNLQEHVMSMRMLPISFVFSRFGRTVHDLCSKLGKQVELHLVGENTELDKTVIEKIGDPMMHLIRNAMDHGFEAPEQRLAAGKPETGVLLLNAYHKGGNVYIEVCDDGRGLDRDRLIAKALEKGLISEQIAASMSDEDAYQLIMHAGLSTANEISNVSGRGVGMDVVRQNIESLHGEILIRSEKGVGTTICIRLPLTLAIMDGQLISVGKDTFVVPVVSIVESLQVTGDMIRMMAGKGELLRYREDYLPILRLHRAFGLDTPTDELEQGVVVVLDVDGKRLAVFVDSIYGQQQVAIKSLESNFERVQGIMGATILGDGSIALILDPPGLSRMNAVGSH
jgi:two-component system chemotaxis sensor kinase CheA